MSNFLDIYNEIFAEGFRDKIFDTELVAALGSALGDKDSDVRSSAVEILTAVIAEGALQINAFLPPCGGDAKT